MDVSKSILLLGLIFVDGLIDRRVNHKEEQIIKKISWDVKVIMGA